MAFMKYRSLSGVKEPNKIEIEICETLCNIQNSFHSAVKGVTALEGMCDDIMGKIKPGREEINVYGHIVRIIDLLKR